MIRVLIVEDEALVAKDIALYLKDAGYNVAGIAHDCQMALDCLNNREVDFAILDINIPGGMDGIDIAEVINDKYRIPFMFVTAFSDLRTLDRAKEVNPSAYIVKPFDEKDMLSSLKIGMHNFKHLNKSKEISLKKLNSKITNSISDKEFEIVLDLLKGFTNSQIAEKQFLSINTVKYHLSNVYLKLDVDNRSKAIGKIMGLTQ